MSYRDVPYDQQSDFQKYLRDRQKVAIAVFGLDNSGVGEIPKVCPDHLHIPLKLLTDKKTGKDAMFCRECGVFWPLEKFDKPKPSRPESKLKQKQTSQSKTFIKQLPHITKKKGGFIGAEDQSSELSDAEFDYVRQIYGNVTSSSEV